MVPIWGPSSPAACAWNVRASYGRACGSVGSDMLHSSPTRGRDQVCNRPHVYRVSWHNKCTRSHECNTSACVGPLPRQPRPEAYVRSGRRAKP
eukprot:scaffold1086_cov397-Prasinococcus_capsulatus_cf.AAC.12